MSFRRFEPIAIMAVKVDSGSDLPRKLLYIECAIIVRLLQLSLHGRLSTFRGIVLDTKVKNNSLDLDLNLDVPYYLLGCKFVKYRFLHFFYVVFECTNLN